MLLEAQKVGERDGVADSASGETLDEGVRDRLRLRARKIISRRPLLQFLKPPGATYRVMPPVGDGSNEGSAAP